MEGYGSTRRPMLLCGSTREGVVLRCVVATAGGPRQQWRAGAHAAACRCARWSLVASACSRSWRPACACDGASTVRRPGVVTGRGLAPRQGRFAGTKAGTDTDRRLAHTKVGALGRRVLTGGLGDGRAPDARRGGCRQIVHRHGIRVFPVVREVIGVRGAEDAVRVAVGRRAGTWPRRCCQDKMSGGPHLDGKRLGFWRRVAHRRHRGLRSVARMGPRSGVVEGVGHGGILGESPSSNAVGAVLGYFPCATSRPAAPGLGRSGTSVRRDGSGKSFWRRAQA